MHAQLCAAVHHTGPSVHKCARLAANNPKQLLMHPARPTVCCLFDAQEIVSYIKGTRQAVEGGGW